MVSCDHRRHDDDQKGLWRVGRLRRCALHVHVGLIATARYPRLTGSLSQPPDRFRGTSVRACGLVPWPVLWRIGNEQSTGPSHASCRTPRRPGVPVATRWSAATCWPERWRRWARGLAANCWSGSGRWTRSSNAARSTIRRRQPNSPGGAGVLEAYRAGLSCVVTNRRHEFHVSNRLATPRAFVPGSNVQPEPFHLKGADGR